MGGLNDPSTSCNIQSPIDEQIEGVLSKLPGNNPLGQWGVPPSSGGSPSSAPSSAGSPPASSAGSPPPASSAAAGSPPPRSSVAHVVSPPAASHPVTKSPATTAVPVSAAPTASHTEACSVVTSYVYTTSVVVTTVTLPAPAGTSAAAPAGWSYKGCFSDNTNNRVLTGITFANIGDHQVTNTKCTAYCGAQGFNLAGTEYAGQCFCGNELNGSSALAESHCDMPCEGDASETCGGSLALSVYTTSSTKAKRHTRRFRGSTQ